MRGRRHGDDLSPGASSHTGEPCNGTPHCTQIWAAPPSTNNSVPVTKLLSSEARKTAPLAISSGVPSRPNGTLATRLAVNCLLSSSLCPSPLRPGVLIGPGLIALTRIFRSLRSTVQVRANDRTAALLAL